MILKDIYFERLHQLWGSLNEFAFQMTFALKVCVRNSDFGCVTL